MVWLAVISLVGSLLFLYGAESSRRDIDACKNWFMSESGKSFSLFGYLYLGRPQIARNEITRNVVLRRRFLIEMYVKSILLFILSVVAFIYAL